MSEEDCPFCRIPIERVFYESEFTLGIWDAFPVSQGHALVITRQHVPSWFEATPKQRIEIVSTIDEVRSRISPHTNRAASTLASISARLPVKPFSTFMRM